MASMNGIQLKGVKTFEGVETYGYSANIYIDGKKAGSVLNDGWGGADRFDWNNKDLADKFKERVGEYRKDHPVYDDLQMIQYTAEQLAEMRDSGTLPIADMSDEMSREFFLSELLMLMDFEKEYKKNLKKSYNLLAVAQALPCKEKRFPRIYTYRVKCSDENRKRDNLHVILSGCRRENKTYTVTVYEKLEDFNV